MLRRRVHHVHTGRKAQTLLEYTMVIGVIILITFAMGPMVKRVTQGMVKVVADKVGSQENAEQLFDDRGHLESSNVYTHSNLDKTKSEIGGITGYIFGDEITSESTTVINMGFTNEN